MSIFSKLPRADRLTREQKASIVDTLRFRFLHGRQKFSGNIGIPREWKKVETFSCICKNYQRHAAQLQTETWQRAARRILHTFESYRLFCPLTKTVRFILELIYAAKRTKCFGWRTGNWTVIRSTAILLKVIQEASSNGQKMLSLKRNTREQNRQTWK